ncbi:MAG: HEAT repeat domain-containing protein [Gemmatimonadota bacterium]|nr:HEAT repeat domain-containing protein [Gemmatimonadota bacterium]
MPTPAAILTGFARLLLMLRDSPDAREQVKDAFRRFAADLGEADHALALMPAGFRWDRVEVPLDRGEVATLYGHLKGHGIGEIRIPGGIATSALVALVRGLSVAPGTYSSFDHLIARLDAAGCGAIAVQPFGAAPETPAPPSIAEVIQPPSPRLSGPREAAPPKRPAAPEDDGLLTDLGPGAVTEARVGVIHFVTRDEGSAAAAGDVVERMSGIGPEQASPELLNQAIAAGEGAAHRDDWAELVGVAHGLVMLERRGGEKAHHRGIGIALRRMLPRTSLERVAKLAARGNQRAEAVAVLRRMGADGTEVLLSHMVECEDTAERRAYFNAVKEMTEGGELLLNMLTHDQWYVVRNVAVLCGELQVEKSVHPLSKLMSHSDERVRRAAAGALARIGGTGAYEPLRRAFQDSAAGVRLEAARNLDGRRNRGLVLTLAVIADSEKVADVQAEMFLALGRLATGEALAALRKAAEPGGRLLRRKPASVRLAAVAGLHAAGPTAANYLKELLDDPEEGVRAAVQKALQTLWE